MKGLLYFSLFTLSLFTFVIAMAGCSDSEEEDGGTFPALVTEMGIMQMGESTSSVTLYTDGGGEYHVASEVQGLQPNSWARCLCGYVVQEAGTVEVRTLQGVAILPNSSKLSTFKRDPVEVVSAWMGGGFVNMHLRKKTKGADHNWGFILDRTYCNAAGGTTYEVSLYHDQCEDPLAYSTDVYFSLDEDALALGRVEGDSILLTVTTFEQEPYQWHFALTY